MPEAYTMCRRWIRLSSALAIASLMLAGCAHPDEEDGTFQSIDVSEVKVSEIPPDGTRGPLGVVTKDRSEGTLPTRPYFDGYGQYARYVEEVAQSACMTRKGYAVPPVPTFSLDPLAAWKSRGYRAAESPETATVYGYHSFQLDYAPTPHDDFVDQLDEHGRADWTACLDEVRARPDFPQKPENLREEVVGVDENPALVDAMKKWRTCMAPLGIPDLPEDRPGLSDSLSQKFGIYQADGPQITADQLSDEEIAVAVKDAQCNQESHYDEIEYGLWWVGTSRLIEAHKAEFLAKKKEFDAYERELQQFLAKVQAEE